MNSSKPTCRNLVLDAGPLLSLSPLRGLAETYFTVPQVLNELKDARAREHFQRLGLMSGVKVEIRSPDPASLAHVIQWAKKTGDYSVLSHPDLCVLALTYALDQEDKKQREETKTTLEPKQDSIENAKLLETTHPLEEAMASVTIEDATQEHGDTSIEDSNLEQEEGEEVSQTPTAEFVQAGATETQNQSVVEREALVENHEFESDPTLNTKSTPTHIYEDPSDEDDGEGEWITPSNVAKHKSRALDLLPDDGVVSKRKQSIGSGCMTADFAMQNVLLQMGLNLVGLEGKRIEKVKSWVLRCHACYKLCKDNTKKFCPSCGNPTLLRTSVTVAAPGASPNAPAMTVHLKPNFQYRLRGTKYSIPAPRPGSAKTGAGTGLILREDQTEYLRAQKRVETKREREEERMLKGILSQSANGKGDVSVANSWMDPDWIPEIMSVGAGGKGRTVRNSRMDGDMPQIGHGRRNPNEKRRKK